MAKDIRMPKMANEWTVRPIRKGPDDDVQGPNLSARYPDIQVSGSTLLLIFLGADRK